MPCANPLLIVLLLPLTSCIPVEDFGPCWDKAVLDARLAGTWKRMAAADTVTVVERNGAYEMTFAREGTKRVKTMKLGPYRFLALGPERGALVRYKLTGHTRGSP